MRPAALPYLMLNGVFDVMIPVRNSCLLSEDLLDPVLITFPDCGHSSLFQLHEPFSRQAAACLASDSPIAPY
jgi:hypothetical protein